MPFVCGKGQHLCIPSSSSLCPNSPGDPHGEGDGHGGRSNSLSRLAPIFVPNALSRVRCGSSSDDCDLRVSHYKKARVESATLSAFHVPVP